MAAVSQRLLKFGVPMQEFPQTTDRLTMAGENLYSLIASRGLRVYADADIRSAISHAVTVEGPRGSRIAKSKASHKIDVVVALAMACLAAVKAPRGQLRMGFQAAPYVSSDGTLTPGYEVDPKTMRPLEPRERTRIKYVKIPEAMAPTAKGNN